MGTFIRAATANRVFADLASMEAAITAALRPLWEDPERVHQLVGENCLSAQVNAFSKN